MPTRKEISDAVDQVTKQLADEGKLVEAGFAAYLITRWGPDALDKMPSPHIGELRYAYMSGAQHLFASMMSIMDEGEEPTEADLKKMDLINAELERWRATAARDHMPTQGSA